MVIWHWKRVKSYLQSSHYVTVGVQSALLTSMRSGRQHCSPQSFEMQRLVCFNRGCSRTRCESSEHIRRKWLKEVTETKAELSSSKKTEKNAQGSKEAWVNIYFAKSTSVIIDKAKCRGIGLSCFCSTILEFFLHSFCNTLLLLLCYFTTKLYWRGICPMCFNLAEVAQFSFEKNCYKVSQLTNANNLLIAIAKFMVTFCYFHAIHSLLTLLEFLHM